jgi:hypothetical protein
LVHPFIGTHTDCPELAVWHWYPAPHELVTLGLHDEEHQLKPFPSVRQRPVEQSEPAVQNRQRSAAPSCGRHAKPLVEA